MRMLLLMLLMLLLMLLCWWYVHVLAHRYREIALIRIQNLLRLAYIWLRRIRGWVGRIESNRRTVLRFVPQNGTGHFATPSTFIHLLRRMVDLIVEIGLLIVALQMLW
uniref:Putative secreted protein n=1 Tax=Anopheles darlingi TaxID=43151 RepID=A0A2M4DF79_ANODA